jgi:hypothetical protein
MHFQGKSTLKNNFYHILKHALIVWNHEENMII